MSIVGRYARVTPEDLDAARQDEDAELKLAQRLLGDQDHGVVMDIDQAWDGIRYLLTAAGAPIDVILGGGTIRDRDWGDKGPVRYLTADEVDRMATYLRSISVEQLASHYDPATMRAADVYPPRWNDANDLGYLVFHHRKLAEFFAAAAGDGHAIITWLA